MYHDSNHLPGFIFAAFSNPSWGAIDRLAAIYKYLWKVYPPENQHVTNMSPEKGDHLKGKIIFQPSIFRRYSLVFRGVFQVGIAVLWFTSLAAQAGNPLKQVGKCCLQHCMVVMMWLFGNSPKENEWNLHVRLLRIIMMVLLVVVWLFFVMGFCLWAKSRQCSLIYALL